MSGIRLSNAFTPHISFPCTPARRSTVFPGSIPFFSTILMFEVITIRSVDDVKNVLEWKSFYSCGTLLQIVWIKLIYGGVNFFLFLLVLPIFLIGNNFFIHNSCTPLFSFWRWC